MSGKALGIGKSIIFLVECLSPICSHNIKTMSDSDTQGVRTKSISSSCVAKSLISTSSSSSSSLSERSKALARSTCSSSSAATSTSRGSA